MIQHIYTAILTKSSDYRENDKLVRLFTLEGGIITAVMKGVKKAGAKLKFGAQPFAFCEYALVQNGAYSTITGCVQIEDLFALSQDYDVFKYSSLILEAADAAASGQANPALFVRLLKAFREILYKDANPLKVCGSFFFDMLMLCGFISKNNSPAGNDFTDSDLKKLIRIAQDSFNCTFNSARLV